MEGDDEKKLNSGSEERGKENLPWLLAAVSGYIWIAVQWNPYSHPLAGKKKSSTFLAHGLTGINWNEKEREREQHRIGSHTEFSSLGLPFLGQIPQKEWESRTSSEVTQKMKSSLVSR